MKLVAKCLVKKLSYACEKCEINEKLKKDFENHLLLPVCLKEYSFTSESLFLMKAEILGNGSKAFLNHKARLFLETGMDIGNFILNGLSKMRELMLSMDIYDFILPEFGVFCGTKYSEDGTFSGGFLKREGILPAYLKKINTEVL